MNPVSVSSADGVALIRIDNPPVNALTDAVIEGLSTAIDAVARDAGVRAVVVLGAGRTFPAGADIKGLENIAWGGDSGAPDLHALLQRIEDLPKPVVIAMHGTALGGGLEIAMAGHYRVALPEGQMGLPEANLGIVPGAEGTQRLPRLVGVGRALLLNLTGDFIDSQTAYDWGLVEKVVPHEELRETALAIARTIASRSPVSVGILRELARTTRDLSLEEGLRREADGFRRCLESEDGAEGVAAFLEKREPTFSGR